MSEPKNYVYISNTKVEMFYQQLASPNIEKTGAAYGVDVKLFKWLGHRETERVITTQMKLDRVIEFLRRSNKHGSVSNPLEYVSGALEMKWGSLHDKLVFFTGKTFHNVIALAGSLKHVVGNAETPSATAGASLLPFMFKVFERYAAKEAQPKEATASDLDLSDDWNAEALRAVLNVSQNFRAPTQKLGFLAKTYIFGDALGHHVLLGSPFYVADVG